MKKIAILLSMVLFFNACGLFSSMSHKDEITGLLTKQEAFDELAGSHILTDEDGEVYALNSTALNLSSQQYLGNEVNVQVEYDEENEVYSVTGVSVLEVLEKDDGKANWVSYMNQQVGFSWKYYDNWEVDEDGDSVTFIAPLQGKYDEDDLSGIDHDYVEIEKRDANNKLEHFEGFTMTESKIGTNQQSAKKYVSQNDGMVIFTVDRDDLEYSIVFYEDEGADNTNENTFHEMLLEFKFVPFDEALIDTGEDEDEDEEIPDEVNDEASEYTDEAIPDEVLEAESSATSYDYSSYSEFESLPYHFSANYPASWYYSGASGTEDGVLHKYGFSDEAVTDKNEFASLKILSGSMPSGTSVSLPNGSGKKVYKGGNVLLYMEIGDFLYSVEGPKDMENILTQIIASITPVDSE